MFKILFKYSIFFLKKHKLISSDNLENKGYP